MSKINSLKQKTAVLLTFLLISLTVAGAAPGDRLWGKLYNGPGNGADQPADVVIDRHGNVYVAGSIDGGAGRGLDYALIKYSPGGARRWSRTYGHRGNDDEARALAVDRGGNIYVTGAVFSPTAGNDLVTIKYGPNGRRKWVRRYNGPGGGDDEGRSIVVDRLGNVYAVGTSDGGGSGADAVIIKYGPLGGERWVRRYNGPANGDDEAAAVALDQSGNIVVAGTSDGRRSLGDVVVAKYGPLGGERWVRRYNGPANGDDEAAAVALDRSGNIVVAGTSDGGRTLDDYLVIKYAPDGGRRWLRRFNGATNNHDQLAAVALDRRGNIFATGTGLARGRGFDLVTVMYSAAGRKRWTARHNGPGNGDDEAVAVTVDSRGEIYIAGTVAGRANNDLAVVKYNQQGQETWSGNYDGPGGNDDEAVDLAVGAAGVYVAGTVYAQVGEGDLTVLKYSP